MDSDAYIVVSANTSLTDAGAAETLEAVPPIAHAHAEGRPLGAQGEGTKRLAQRRPNPAQYGQARPV